MYFSQKSKPEPQVIPESTLRKAGIFEAVAADVRPLSRKRKDKGLERFHAGTRELNLSSDYVRGWPYAMRLVPGQRYRVEYAEAVGATAEHSTLPSDEITANSLTFISIARVLKGKDPFDARRSLKGLVGVWTDGVMLTAPEGTETNQLEVGKVYRVVVTVLESTTAS